MAGTSLPPHRVGRKREIETDQWSHLPFKIPRAMMVAFENYLHDEGRKIDKSLKKVPFLRDWLERLLVEAGYLRVILREDRDSQVKSYEAVEPPAAGRSRPRR